MIALPWLKLAFLAVSLILAMGGGIGIGSKWTRGEWAQADLKRERAAAEDAFRRGETALRSAQQFEVDREHIRARLRASDARLRAALAAQVPQCPGVVIGDLPIGGDLLRGVRRAAGQLEPDADAPKP